MLEVWLYLVLQGRMALKKVCRDWKIAQFVLRVTAVFLFVHLLQATVSSAFAAYSALIHKCFSQGFYCLEGSSQRPTSQFMCPQGYYCEEGTATPHGSPCPVGTAGEQLGQTSRAACKRCREGRFCPAGKSLHLYTHFTGATKTETQKNVGLRKWIHSHFGKSNEKKAVCYDKTSLVLFTSTVIRF